MSYLQVQDMVLEREEKSIISEMELIRAKLTKKYISGNLNVQSSNQP